MTRRWSNCKRQRHIVSQQSKSFEANMLARKKNVIIVHAAGQPSRGAEAEFHARLEQVGANLVGAVLNKVRPEDSRGLYYCRRAYRELALRQPASRAVPRG